MAGFGASGSGGQGFAIRLEADGDTKLGNSSGDLHQITGTIDQLGTSFQINGDDARIKINGDSNSHPGLEFRENGTRKWIIFNNYVDDSLDFKTNSNTRMVINQDGTVGIGTESPGTTLDVAGDVNFDGSAVFNESSADKDFRVESNNATHMFFIDGGSNRLGIGTGSPQHTIDIQERTGIEAVIRLQGTADVGIRLAADSDNSGENDNPYIDWYQDGQNSNSRANRLASIAMEGDAGATFTGSIANALFLSTFCPNAQSSSLRPFQIATDSSNNGFRNRLTIEGANGHIGIGKNNPDVELDVNGEIRGTVMSSSAGATFLGDVITKDIKASGSITVAGTAITSTPAELNLLDASVTSEPSDGVWAVVERIAKATLDSNDWSKESTPQSLGVIIPDNAILTKIVFDTTQTFAAGDDGAEAMSIVDFGLYNGNTQVIPFANQTMINRSGASSGDKPYFVGVTEILPISAGLSAKLTAALTIKFHVIDEGGGQANSLDAGLLDVFVYYIMGA